MQVCMCVSTSGVQLFATPWTVVCQAPLFMGFPRQEYWNGLPFPSPEGLADPGIEPIPFALQADSLPLSHPGSPVTQVHLAHTRLVNSGVPRSEIYREPTKFWCIHISKRVLSQVNQIQTESKTRSHDLSVNLQMSQ